MATLPQPIKKRNPQNARLGIKSSLSNLKRVVSLVYLLYIANDRKGKIDYSEEYTEGGATKIRLKDAYKASVSSIFAPGVADAVIAANPLLTSQLEPLQVGLELVFQLGKINFVGRKASSAERTGGNRYAKTITFSKNLILLDVYFSALPEDVRKRVLVFWMKNEESVTDRDVNLAIYRILTAFTENLKMSVDNGTANITFEQEGLYKELLSGNKVIGKDVHEDVGPLRIYKSFVKEEMHPYVSLVNNEFVLKVDEDELKNYLSLVSTDLDLKNSEVPEGAEEESENKDGSPEGQEETDNGTVQIIYYGCPGTGKSFKVKGKTEGQDGKKAVYFNEKGERIDWPEDESERITTPSNIFRTTFHPDYDYATFVGTYKPVMKPLPGEEDKENPKEELSYDFVPQVFTKAYVRAWKSWTDDTLVDEDKNVYLIIEEINRGNCAQIFGDLFQLLDRKNGYSEFPIIPDAEMSNYLKKQQVPFESLRLPPNLHIYATMNTSDQSLFPMDSAFKRRWSMEYIPIKYEGNEAENYKLNLYGTEYSWPEFLRLVNAKIRLATNSEDKQMGEFFIKNPQITEKEFINKVMFYLWNDVCKDLYSATRPSNNYFLRDSKDTLFTFAELFSGRHKKGEEDTKPKQLIAGFMAYLKSEETEDNGENANEQGQDPMKEEQQ